MDVDVSDTVRELLLRLPVREAARHKLVALMSAPGRYYHNLSHIGTLWQRHCQFGAGTEFRAQAVELLIACAIAYHDAVYDTSRADNETVSAALWRKEAGSATRLTAAEIDWVTDTIEATSWHFGPRPTATVLDRARTWMLDLDLTPLGEPAEVFAHNTQLLRMEVPDLTEAAWNHQRLAFLAHADSYPRIFRSDVLADAFEAQARANIARELRGVIP